MYAIIETGGKQYKVVKGDKLEVEKLEAQAGQEIAFNALWAGGDEAARGKQTAKVVAKILRHFRGEKVVSFKRRPKKAYEVKRGHRQSLTEIEISDIQL